MIDKHESFFPTVLIFQRLSRYFIPFQYISYPLPYSDEYTRLSCVVIYFYYPPFTPLLIPYGRNKKIGRTMYKM